MSVNCVLIRYGEVAVKSHRKRPFFEKLFINSIQEACSRFEVPFTKIKNLGKMFAIFTSNPRAVCEVLSLVPGVESYSPCTYISFLSSADLIENVTSLCSTTVSSKKFRVTVKRSGSHSFSSMSLAKKIGSSLYPYSAGVDLNNPDITVYVDVRDSSAFVFFEYVRGVGGLPSKSVGRSLMLFSGGIDSPVASYEMLKRGCALDFVFVNFVGDTVFSQVAKVYNFLISRYAYNYTPRLFHVRGDEIRSFLENNVPSRLRQLALKQILYAISTTLAKDNSMYSFVTGESLSQKSSQTLPSLSFIQPSTSLLVLRPLLTSDKNDIVDIARSIGTFHFSESVKEQCSMTDGPVTAVPIVDDQEKIPDLSLIVSSCLDQTRILSGPVDIVDHSLDSIDMSSAKVVDVRPEGVRVNKPLSADISCSYSSALSSLKELFSKENSYVIVCSQGVLSFELAHRLSKKNISAVGLSVSQYLKHKNTK
ncbi:MAG: tRNA sulfurtransferase [Nanobdellota archaeon]